MNVKFLNINFVYEIGSWQKESSCLSEFHNRKYLHFYRYTFESEADAMVPVLLVLKCVW